MHCVCQGVYKKFSEEWLEGKFDNVRYSAASVLQINAYRDGIRWYIPYRNFARKKISTGFTTVESHRTETRFDLYFPDGLKLHLSSSSYKDLCLLHVAIKILVKKEPGEDSIKYANSLLKIFVETSRSIFGPQFITTNVHSLTHRSADFLNTGCLIILALSRSKINFKKLKIFCERVTGFYNNWLILNRWKK